MENNTFAKHPTFYAVGLSYKKADAEMRAKFSLDDKAKQNLLHQAKETEVAPEEISVSVLIFLLA